MQDKAFSIGISRGWARRSKTTAECLLERYPWIKVRWVGEGGSLKKNEPCERDDTKEQEILRQFLPIFQRKIQLIFYCRIWFPKQRSGFMRIWIRSRKGSDGSWGALIISVEK